MKPNHLQLWVKKSRKIVFKAIITRLFSRKLHNETSNGRSSDLLPSERLPIPHKAGQWQEYSKVLELTAAGTVADFSSFFNRSMRGTAFPFKLAQQIIEQSTILATILR